MPCDYAHGIEVGLSFLGGLTPREFLHRHWQKRPLLVRGALPGFRGIADRATLARLARRNDVESRLVERRAAGWSVEHGPFSGARLARAGGAGWTRPDWTLLVSGLNLHLPAADELLRRFAFVPQARLDDLMVSVAGPGGGVGPHYDAYDVFLIQGVGRRLWRLCRPRAFAVEPGAPLRLIRDFIAEEEVLVEPGDLLYLPPGWGHDGIALEPCQTCSVGFRAPRGEELAAAFLDWLHARGLPDRGYRDPDLAPARHSARIPAELLAHARASIARLRWSARDVGDFLGEQLTAPKPHVVFARPQRPLAPAAFAARMRRSEVRLDPKTQLLYRGRRFFRNGDAFTAPERARTALAILADSRCAPGTALVTSGLAGLLYAWYLDGSLHLHPACRRAGGKRR